MRVTTSAAYPTFQREDLNVFQAGSSSPYSAGKKNKSETEPRAAISKMSSRMYNQLAPVSTKPEVKKANAARGDYTPAVKFAAKPPAKPQVMKEYARGPVGFLQWLAVVHPNLYDDVRKQHPELLVQAHEITAQIEASNVKQIPECPGCSAALAGGCSGCANDLGRGDVYSLGSLGFGMDSLTSWVTSASGIIGNLAKTYSDVRTATSHPVVNAQLQQAAAAQPPVNYNNPPATPPGGPSVTGATTGFGSMGVMIGLGAVAVVGGILLLKKK
jgi:hypothetical protein